MDTRDVILPVKGLEDLLNKQKELAAAVPDIQTIKEYLPTIVGILQGQAVDFVNELGHADLPLSVTASITSYLADRVTAPGFSSQVWGELKGIPAKTKRIYSIIASGEHKYDDQLLSIFFKYAETDKQFGAIRASFMHRKFVFFRESLHRIGRFLAHGVHTVDEFRKRATEYENRVATRNNLYGKNWDTMSTALAERLNKKQAEGVVYQSPAWKALPERRLLTDIEMLERFESWPHHKAEFQLRLSNVLHKDVRPALYAWIESKYVK